MKLRHEAALSAVPGSASEAFWQQAVHSLPSTARPIPAGLGALKMCCSETATGVATRRRCVLDSAVLQRLRTLAVQERVTIAALCHTAWAIVQWVYVGRCRRGRLWVCPVGTHGARAATRAGHWASDDL